MGQEDINREILNEIKALSINVATLTANSKAQRESIISIQDCLTGLDEWQRDRDEASARHSEKIKAIRDDVDELTKKQDGWIQSRLSILNSIAIAIVTWFMFGGGNGK